MISAAHSLPTEVVPPGRPTQLKRPEEKAILSFKAGMVGSDTIGTLLDHGWSLGICCRNCPRTIEKKPEAIRERFGVYRRMKLADLLPKLSCGTEKGCGSTDMVLFPWQVKTPKDKASAKLPPVAELPF